MQSDGQRNARPALPEVDLGPTTEPLVEALPDWLVDEPVRYLRTTLGRPKAARRDSA